MSRTFFIIITLHLAISLNAQYLSQEGRYEVDEIKGCVPLTITITPIINKPTWDIDYGDGTVVQNVFTHTYNTAGDYVLIAIHPSEDPRRDTVFISVLPDIPPAFEIQSCAANELTVNITDQNYDSYAIDYDNDGADEFVINQGNPVPSFTYPGQGTYQIKVKGINNNAADNCSPEVTSVTTVYLLSTSTINSLEILNSNSLDISYLPVLNTVLQLEYSPNGTGNYSVLEVLDGSGTQTIQNPLIDHDNNFYCFRIGSYDPCNNTSIYSNEVCSIPLTLQSNDGSMDLSWQTAGNIIGIDIYKDGNILISTTGSNFSDVDVICERSYCYQLTANYSSGATSTSRSFCDTTFTTAPPPSITNIVSLVDDQNIQLNWEEPATAPISEYKLTKTIEGDVLKYKFTSATPEFSDITTNPINLICYDISYTNECNNASIEDSPICPMILKASISGDNIIRLKWNSYEGYASGILQYRIEKYDENLNLLSTFSSNSSGFDDTEDTGHQILFYRIFAVPVDGTYNESYSRIVKVVKRAFISRPQAFTPNGDGLNDQLEFSGTYIQDFELRVFNKWGELMFISDSMDAGWNGTYRGKIVPSGSYAYIVKLKDLAQREWQVNGLVAVIRN